MNLLAQIASSLGRLERSMSEGGLHPRLLAILAADAAGYSGLMAADERTTIAALDAARRVFSREIRVHSGRIVDTAGDSILAVFETVAGAVDAALAMQQQMARDLTDTPRERQMLFRIGIHLGDVIEKADGTVYGNGVNVAARLQALAEVGGVSVSDSVRSAISAHLGLNFEDLGRHATKNIAEPVHIFRLRTAIASPQRMSPDGQYELLADEGLLLIDRAPAVLEGEREAAESPGHAINHS